MNQYVFCDPNLCIGCSMCERRCIMAHQGLDMKEVQLDNPMHRQRCKSFRTPEMKISVHCRHCEASPCLHSCPVGAIEKSDYNGGTMIYIDEGKCIGCRECIFACPFGAVYMGPLEDGRMVATKCDLCVGIEGSPQCVQGCPKKALILMTEEGIGRMVREKSIDTLTDTLSH